MPVETIQVTYVNPPKPGGKMGTVKDTEGRYFGVWPDKLYQYQQGGTYEVEYDTKNYEGKTYRTIKRIVSGETPEAGHANGKAPGGSGGYKPDIKSVEMAIMGIVGRAYHGTGSLPPENVLEADMLAVKHAWEACWSNKPKAPLEPPDVPSDEIPF